MLVDVSICIINHQTPLLLQQCLDSIAATIHDITHEILVVNNTPDEDGSIQSIIDRYPAAYLIQNDRPRGFASNQNQMLARARGRYLMPLNSDTLVQPGALYELVRFMDVHQQAGISGPMLLYGDGRLQPSCRNFPTPLTHFLEASGIWKLLRGNRLIENWYYICSSHIQVREVDWLTGACLIVRAKAARQVGYYNEDLFPGLDGEDIEWCWRMKQAGWSILFDPQAVVVHLENQSPMHERALQLYRGFYAFCAHYYSRPMQRSIRMATILALIPRWLFARSNAARSTYAKLIQLPIAL